MSGADRSVLELRSIDRLNQFLIWLMPVSIAFATGETLFFVITGYRSLGVAAVITWFYVWGLLVSRGHLRHGQPQLALIPISVGLLAVGLSVVSFWPFLLTSLALLPIMVVSLAMPHLPARPLLHLGLACWVITLLMAVLAEIVPAPRQAITWVDVVLRVVCLTTASALVLVLLWESSKQLLETIRAGERANEALSQAQAALTSEHAQLLVTLQCIADGVIAADEHGSITRFNNAAAELTGWPEDEAVGHPLWEVLRLRRADNDAPLTLSVASAEGAGALVDPSHSVLLQTRSGATFPVEARVAPLRNGAGEFQGLVMVLRDLTARVRAEEERLAWQRSLSDMQRMESLGLLAGGVAHDFNNLLTVVLGNAQLALLEVEDNPLARQSLDAAIGAAHHASALTRQMLTYAGRAPSATQPVDLNGLITQMRALLHSVVSKNITLELRPATRLPLIKADPTQMRQVIMNLVINAAEAIGGESGTVTLWTELEGQADGEGRVLLRVSDTGCGMDAETQGRIFEPFFSTKFTGRGLGLASVQGIVRGHHGELSVTSQTGQGTTFTIALPAAGETHIPETDRLDEAVWHGQGTVLLIDDEPEVRATITRMLQHYGLHVLSAHDGASGIALFQMVPDDIVCVLLDMTMPGMPSDEVAARLRQIQPNLGIVLMSGHQSQPSWDDAGNQEAFLPKPFTLGDLGVALRRTLERAQPEQLNAYDVGGQHP
ncbi:MAG TPA: ATP-binding protein [Roseiflexaceae bacterium]|nr:ATP-binding protein [Roseiflexaceae bacterium]